MSSAEGKIPLARFANRRDAGRQLAEVASHNQTVIFQFSEMLRQHFLGDAGHVSHKL